MNTDTTVVDMFIVDKLFPLFFGLIISQDSLVLVDWKSLEVFCLLYDFWGAQSEFPVNHLAKLGGGGMITQPLEISYTPDIS